MTTIVNNIQHNQQPPLCPGCQEPVNDCMCPIPGGDEPEPNTPTLELIPDSPKAPTVTIGSHPDPYDKTKDILKSKMPTGTARHAIASAGFRFEHMYSDGDVWFRQEPSAPTLTVTRWDYSTPTQLTAHARMVADQWNADHPKKEAKRAKAAKN